MQAELAVLDEQVAALQRKLSSSKRVRDALREENATLKQNQGFIGRYDPEAAVHSPCVCPSVRPSGSVVCSLSLALSLSLCRQLLALSADSYSQHFSCSHTPSHAHTPSHERMHNTPSHAHSAHNTTHAHTTCTLRTQHAHIPFSDLLVEDFERRKSELREERGKVAQLKSQHALLHSVVKKASRIGMAAAAAAAASSATTITRPSTF